MNPLDAAPEDAGHDADAKAAPAEATPAATPAADQATPDAKQDDGYVPVAGLGRKDVEHMRECEALVSAKTASDYEHVVWAYGILWALFAAYGIFLWRRSALLRQDLEDVRRQVGRSGS